jgi:peptidyl-prolyl cis-trans isomerase D
MLEMLRNATGGWVAKIFIALLVASFAVFGIADIFTGGQGNVLATVGKTEIAPFEYQRLFRAEVRALSQRLGRAIDPVQARALGLDRQVLSQLIGQAALDNHVEDLGLKISDKTIAESIANNPAFKDGRGDFNRTQFQTILFQNGLTEQAYVASERSSLLRGQIGRIIETGITPPDFLLKTLFKYQSEKRQVSYFNVPASAAGTIAEPTEVEISGYFDKNKSEFKSPEYRKLTILSVQPADIADTIEVTDEELKQAYSQRSDQFERPEKREVLQIAFPTKGEAEKARTGLTTFEDFKALATKRGMKDSDLTLGLVEKSQIGDTKFSEAAFALPENKISDPVQGTLSTALIYVKKIEKGGLASFEDVQEKLKSTLLLERAQEEILNFQNSIEDELAGGATLIEIAKRMSLNAINIDRIDRSGSDENGIKVSGLPTSSELMTQAFNGEVGEEIAPIETSDNGFIWVNIEEIIPVEELTLERARADIVKRWKEEEHQKKLAAFTSTLVDRLKAGESFLKVASGIGSKVKLSKELTRFASEDALSQVAVTKVFISSLDEIASANANDADARVVFKVTDISVPSFDSASVDAKALQNFLTTSLSDDLMRHYELALRQNIDININQRVWDQLNGSGTTGADPFHGIGPHAG